ncbi:MAG: L-threonylcarbamoyladenylate synthase [Candidatus Vogelbacteria bacterium]|nr:L-threonylcarbamoyladenylate synthase [Candidatus Vogelbacteria bacterium]
MTIKQAIKILKNGAVGVIPTDTIYGLVGQALKLEIVARIYALKHRRPKKPSIVLISDIADLKKFNLRLTRTRLKTIKRFWPGSTSIIFNKTIACRLPAPSWLRRLLKQTGPLIAPSANPEGRPAAQTITQARKYFGDQVDFYLDGGQLDNKPSRLVAIKNGKIITIRP